MTLLAVLLMYFYSVFYASPNFIVMIKFYLLDNPLTPDPTDFRAEVVDQPVRTEKDIVKMILHRNVGLSESQILSVLKEERAAIELFLEEGDCVSTELFTVKPKVKGVFYSKTEGFDRSKHQVNLKLRPSAGLRKVTEKIAVERVAEVKPAPLLSVLVDYASDTQNEVVTPGQMARIYGERLKYDVEDPLQGIFFINDRKKESKVATVADNLPKSLTFNVPVLPQGTYRLIVRSAYKMKGLREGELDDMVEVI